MLRYVLHFGLQNIRILKPNYKKLFVIIIFKDTMNSAAIFEQKISIKKSTEN